jgi:hypothetical protein
MKNAQAMARTRWLGLMVSDRFWGLAAKDDLFIHRYKTMFHWARANRVGYLETGESGIPPAYKVLAGRSR